MTLKIEPKHLKNLSQLYKSLVSASYKTGMLDIPQEKPLFNFDDEMRNIPEFSKYYDLGIFMESLQSHMISIGGDTTKITATEVENLANQINNTFLANIEDHIIVVPVLNLEFSDLIKLDRFTFIPQSFSEKQKTDIIQKLSKSKAGNTKFLAEHTKKSRSDKFFEMALVCIKVKNQSSWVIYNATRIAKFILCILRIVYWSEIKNTGADNTSKLKSSSLVDTFENTHIAIFSNENYRQGHGVIRFDTNLNFSLDWLKEKKYQKMFKELCESFIFNSEKDDFKNIFFNSLLLFNDALEQENNRQYSLTTILLMTAGEIIITRDRNEKRLRLSTILPRITGIEKAEVPDMVKTLKKIYEKRNNFVHAGESIIFKYKSKEDNEYEKYLEPVLKIIAKMVFNYPKYLKHIDFIINSSTDKNIKRIKAWDNFIDEIFESIFSGEFQKLKFNIK